MNILVTGGAGYIGSHIVRQLGESNHRVTVLDNLSTGHAWAVLSGELIEADLADRERVRTIVASGRFDAVIHMAASIVVPESVADPLAYYRNNTVHLINLLDACASANTPRLIFSSTAAVYGTPASGICRETTPLTPINPYGASKMMSERVIADYAAASEMRYVALRYFNVAGAELNGRIGQATPTATHLIKVACQAATGQRTGLDIFGSDYPTPDGTCVRDYIHVEDLAAAHLAALDYLHDEGESTALNCGYGHGLSVREVIDTVQRLSGVQFPVVDAPRRAGDPAHLVADNRKLLDTLRWQPRYDDIEIIVQSALDWEKILQQHQG
ncbi:MAG: UDP-glucose 4-epimerase GalE [Gammaproteobacteria bacterium]|nr:UDP-glucose 4-epimerase GalE [Gammaproteobacteria bacterium]